MNTPSEQAFGLMEDVGSLWKMRPNFLRTLGDIATEHGSNAAMRCALEQANIAVDIRSPDDVVTQLDEHRGSVLFVGDHRKQWEFVALMALAATVGRSDLYHVAKFYVMHQVSSALGKAAASKVLPVHPRILANDVRHGVDAEVVSRLVYRQHLRNTAESKMHNERVISSARQLLHDGHMVNIFPCGKITDALKSTWRTGLGRVISGLSEDDRASTLLCMYRFGEGMSRTNFLARISTIGTYTPSSTQLLPFEVLRVATIAETMASMRAAEQANPTAITSHVRQLFLRGFN